MCGHELIEVPLTRWEELTEIVSEKATQWLMKYVPLLARIRQVLDTDLKHKINKELFLDELERTLSEQAAEEVLEVAIDWGRYAEIFAYDYNTGNLSLENPE
jgi:NitT/TauT family transport system ATP-binding protein